MARSAVLEIGSRERNPTASSEQLLDATASLLSERTALDVSLSDIAKRSGLNSALIKYYFGNKGGLLLALLERDSKVAMAALAHLVAMRVSAEQKLKIHVSGLINAFYRAPYLNRLIHYMIAYGDDVSSRRVVTMFREPMVAAYEAIIAQGVAEGHFRPVDPTLLYHSLTGACEHIFNAASSAPSARGEPKMSEEMKQRHIEHVTEIFLRGLRPGLNEY